MMLLAHGWPKLSNYGELLEKFPDPLGMGSGLSLFLAVSSEVGASVLIIAGLLTRLASVPLLITMLVAGFVVHGSDPFATQEKAFVYAVAYLALILTGPGRLSLDNLLHSRLWLKR